MYLERLLFTAVLYSDIMSKLAFFSGYCCYCYSKVIKSYVILL